MIDILTEESFDISGKTTTVEIPCGMFRFIDVELSEVLK